MEGSDNNVRPENAHIFFLKHEIVSLSLEGFGEPLRYLIIKDRYLVRAALKGQRAARLPQIQRLRRCSPWNSSLSAPSPGVMTAGSLDNEAAGLDWTCYSITFHNIYIALWEGRLGYLCMCGGFYSHATVREESNK